MQLHYLTQLKCLVRAAELAGPGSEGLCPRCISKCFRAQSSFRDCLLGCMAPEDAFGACRKFSNSRLKSPQPAKIFAKSSMGPDLKAFKHLCKTQAFSFFLKSDEAWLGSGHTTQQATCRISPQLLSLFGAHCLRRAEDSKEGKLRSLPSGISRSAEDPMARGSPSTGLLGSVSWTGSATGDVSCTRCGSSCYRNGGAATFVGVAGFKKLF